MRDTFIKVVEQEVKTNQNIYLITGDLGFGVFDNFRREFPDNFINAGISEQNMTGLATGMALDGNIAITYSIANFPIMRCLEQIRNDACYHDANVKIVSIGGGFSYGALGMSHHATEDIAIMNCLPNIRIFTPSTKNEVKKITKEFLYCKGTCYLRLDKSFGNDAINHEFELYKGRIIKSGTDFTIFTYGGILEEAQEAAIILEEQHNINVRIITFPILKPIDKDIILTSIKETKNILTLEEHNNVGGLSSIVAEIITTSHVYPDSFEKISLNGQYSSIVGSQKYLRERYNMSSKNIVQVVLKNIKR